MQISKAADELLFFPLVSVPRDQIIWIIFSSLVDLSLRGKVKNKTGQGVQAKSWACFQVFSLVWQHKMQAWGAGWRAILIPTPENPSCKSSFHEKTFCKVVRMKQLEDGAWQQAMSSLEISEKKADRHVTRQPLATAQRLLPSIQTSSAIGVMTQQGTQSSKLICDKPGKKQEWESQTRSILPKW